MTATKNWPQKQTIELIGSFLLAGTLLLPGCAVTQAPFQSNGSAGSRRSPAPSEYAVDLRVVSPQPPDRQVSISWSTQLVASAGRPAPREGYWDPEDVCVVVVRSQTPVLRLPHDTLIYITLPEIREGIITGITFVSFPNGLETRTANKEQQHIHPVISNPRYMVGVVPLPVQGPLVLANLEPGFYALAMALRAGPTWRKTLFTTETVTFAVKGTEMGAEQPPGN